MTFFAELVADEAEPSDRDKEDRANQEGQFKPAHGLRGVHRPLRGVVAHAVEDREGQEHRKSPGDLRGQGGDGIEQS